VKITSQIFLAAALLISSAVYGFCGEPGWTTDYAKAVEQARTENKAILLDFTGSDWCGWCMKMKEETLDTPMFKSYARKNLVLVEVDFPHSTPQSDAVKAQNQQLSQQFQVSGFPAFILLDKSGSVLGRQNGYLEGGSSAFLAELRKFYTPPPDSANASSADDFDAFFKKPAQNPTP